MYLNREFLNQLQDELVTIHGESHHERIARGVSQAASFWQESDGSPDDFAVFCREHFIAEAEILDSTLDRVDRIFEAIDGHFTSMHLCLREKTDLDQGPLHPLDLLFAAYQPAAHIIDDFFKNKIAFALRLNFPQYTLEEKRRLGPGWNSRQWAGARLGDFFHSRLPAEIIQKIGTAASAARVYISEYNIHLGNLLDHNQKPLFPPDLVLISHWGLRDELKSHYGRKDGRDKQELIFAAMNRIITQEIPAEAINNPAVKWNPFDNTVHNHGKAQLAPAEPDRRYRHILAIFHAMQEADAYFPDYPTYIRRKFELERSLFQTEVEALFDQCLQSPQLAKVGTLIRKRMGRDLRPYDIWYDGFKPRSGMDEGELSRKTAHKYPDAASFEANLQVILEKLGFSSEQAAFLASKVRVEASRGPGHAWGARMREEISRLRTRLPQSGMDYKGFNTAIHELGHNVEQTLSLHGVDFHLLRGVPLTGFSEAFAFVFQNRDLELLGIEDNDPEREHRIVLDRFWNTCEAMAVAWVDTKIWEWLYHYPQAGPADLKKATLEIARTVWNRYFAPVIGLRDEIVLAVYSHLVMSPLYMADYPIGQLAEHQIEAYLEGKNLGGEMSRICSAGNISPQLWMKKAVGRELSASPMLEAVDRALAALDE